MKAATDTIMADHDTVPNPVHDGLAAGSFAVVASPEMITFTIFGVMSELPLLYRPQSRWCPTQIATELAHLVPAAPAVAA